MRPPRWGQATLVARSAVLQAVAGSASAADAPYGMEVAATAALFGKRLRQRAAERHIGGDAGGFGDGEVGFHELGEFFDFSFQFSTFQSTLASAATNYDFGAKFFCKGHLFLQAERSEVIASDAAHAQDTFGGFMALQHFRKYIVAHLLDLFALVAVNSRPNIYSVCPSLSHLG